MRVAGCGYMLPTRCYVQSSCFLMLLYYRQQCSGRPVWDYFHRAKSWRLAGVTHAKHPQLLARWRVASYPIPKKQKSAHRNITGKSSHCRILTPFCQVMIVLIFLHTQLKISGFGRMCWIHKATFSSATPASSPS